jgi:predicted metalloprotease
LIAYFLGVDPGVVTNDSREVPKGAPTDEMGLFVARVLGSTEDVWGNIFSDTFSAASL